MENRNFTLLKWSVVVLVVLNIVLMASMWIRPGGHRHGPPPPHPGPGGPKMMIIEELKFTKEQTSKFETLVDEHRKAMRELEEKSRELREEYFSLLASDSPDQKKKEELETTIANNQKAIDVVTFDHFKQVRELCTPEQKKRFDEIIGDIIKHMRGPHGPPPPPPHGPPPPGA
jgi:protein CpxP